MVNVKAGVVRAIIIDFIIGAIAPVVIAVLAWFLGGLGGWGALLAGLYLLGSLIGIFFFEEQAKKWSIWYLLGWLVPTALIASLTSDSVAQIYALFGFVALLSKLGKDPKTHLPSMMK